MHCHTKLNHIYLLWHIFQLSDRIFIFSPCYSYVLPWIVSFGLTSHAHGRSDCLITPDDIQLDVIMLNLMTSNWWTSSYMHLMMSNWWTSSGAYINLTIAIGLIAY